VAEIAAAHGGEVTVGDSPLSGARFTVRLPV
jgi:signal transduction histidine kinase